MAVWVTDARVLTGLGNLEDTWQALLEKRSAIRGIERFDTRSYTCTIGAWVDGLRGPEDGRSMVHGLLDRLFESPVSVPEGTLVITASTKAGIDSLEAFSRGCSGNGAPVLPSGLPGTVADRLGIATYGANVSAACASSTVALSRAASMIESAIVESIAVCCLDLLTEFVFSGFSSLRILSSRPCRPFDRQRDGLSLGEGAALFIVMAEKKARQMDLPCRGVISGWGIANDAEHILSPAIDGRGLVSAARQALRRARIKPWEVGAVSAHGTGTTQNDAMELRAFPTIFGTRQLPVYSIKGAVGHSLGAAGGIETAMALQALASQVVPPTTGFTETEEGVETRITREATPIRGRSMLVTNSGFGGVNCALVLQPGRET